MLHLRRIQIIEKACRIAAMVTLLLAPVLLQAQRELNMPNFEDRKYYFGITFAYNRSHFNSTNHPRILQTDSILVANTPNAGGASFGFMASRKLGRRVDVRFNPQLVFANKVLEYSVKYPNAVRDESPIMTRNVESIIFSAPFHVKLNSDRIRNFSFYSFVGWRFDMDLASNARNRQAENLIKLVNRDMGYDLGVGFQFYFPSFIFTPEIKISNGIRNLHSRDQFLKFSSSIDQLRSRMITFSIHLQG
jgi:hypothetical protein